MSEREHGRRVRPASRRFEEDGPLPSPHPVRDPAVTGPAGVLALQRAAGNAATARLLSQAPTGRRSLQRAWTEEKYTVDASERTLHVDPKPVQWGGTAPKGQHAGHRATRAILFETIATPAHLGALLGRLNQVPLLWDVGLTLVLNTAYTPPVVYDQQTPTKKARTLGTTAAKAKDNVLNAWTQAVAAWAGPPVQIVIAAWERRERQAEVGTALEAVQASVPYTTLRRIAATNPGAAEIDAELNKGHDNVWRKMGDDDMPIVNPNAAGPEMGKLAQVEQEGFYTNTFVTFGYNLVTAGTVPPVTGILEAIYTKEMELRDAIAAAKAPMYPSEPTTFYRPVTEGAMDAPWRLAEGVKTGGSGQQLEGAKLATALRGGGGMAHLAFHTVKVNTGAGARNDAIVGLLMGWWNGGNGDPFHVEERLLDAELNKLDQSALKEGEYMKKVIDNLGVKPDPGLWPLIPPMVTRYRSDAVADACRVMRERLRERLYLAAWAQDSARKGQKLGAL